MHPSIKAVISIELQNKTVSRKEDLDIDNKLQIIFDLTFATIFIILFLPIYFSIAIAIKLSSKGSVIYKQERIGKNGKPFTIYKFRSMIMDAEKNGPELSPENDERVTKLGRFLRRTKLDETPQFFNVLKGDMSLVGPRPERKFYIEQILKQEPNFTQTFTVKPGITSLGQVKYGYAQNIKQMLERYKYDMFYLKNKSRLLILLLYNKDLIQATK